MTVSFLEPFDLSCVTRAVHTQEKFDAIKQRIKIVSLTLLFIYLALPTGARSPQQHMPITVGPFT
jgi:hypothetical protein